MLPGYPAREPRRCRNDGGDTYDEEKRRENDILRSTTVPWRMKQRPVGGVKVARIVDKNHERNGEATQEIEREQTIRRLRQRRRVVGLSGGKLCLDFRTQGARSSVLTKCRQLRFHLVVIISGSDRNLATLNLFVAYRVDGIEVRGLPRW